MRYLHTMVRISDIDASLAFYCEGLSMREYRRVDNDKGRFTLIFLSADEDFAEAEKGNANKGNANKGNANKHSTLLELTYNWDKESYSGGRNFGHLAYQVANIYETCAHLQAQGVTINRPPRDGHMAFVRSPDGISIELLQRGESLPAQEPWLSMENSGSW